MSLTASRPTDLGAPRWRGQRGRTEVWYATLTDRRTGTGVWVHHETVAPKDDAAPYAHGWTAVFEPDAPPIVERFGPQPVHEVSLEAWHAVGGCGLGDGWLRGEAGSLAWDLTYRDQSTPLYTFPRRVWERELLPGAQIVPSPSATFTGAVTIGGRALAIEGPGALARIYGHGSAQRWGWLHADLDGAGTLEIVTATARRAALRRVPPLALVQLRLPGRADWPRHPLLAAPRFRTALRPGGFDVRGRSGGGHLIVHVDLSREASVALQYTDPDGATATCTNSERARATVRFDQGDRVDEWHLDGVAHAEVGIRP